MGSYKGLSDLTAVRTNKWTAPQFRVVWIECKAGKDKLSKYQEAFKYHIESHGGEYLVVRDIDDLKGCE